MEFLSVICAGCPGADYLLCMQLGKMSGGAVPRVLRPAFG